jgi:2-oxoisovalerate dehydrogenase E2 component (dihydrolipoyl transacylase)
LGMGRISDVPVFGKDDTGIERLVKERQVILSWSADHRIIDGATVAKAADMLAALLSRPESLGLILK